MTEREESEFHDCICSKLDKLTIPGIDGQSWTSISVYINFGDYKKTFKINNKYFPSPTEIGNVPQALRNFEAEEEIHTVEETMNSPIVPTTSNQNSNTFHVTRAGRNSIEKTRQTHLDSDLEASNLPKVSSTKKQPKISASTIQKKLNKCPTCSRQFSTKYNLITHQKMKHSDEQTKADWRYECNVCSKKFFRIGDLNQHKKVHLKKEFKCPECPNSYKWKSEYVTHLKNHENDSPFSCNFCNKVLSSAYRLEAHIRVHTREKPYKCLICDKYYAEKGHLKLHLQRVHIL